jgi:hypothetical protein
MNEISILIDSILTLAENEKFRKTDFQFPGIAVYQWVPDK